jgi:hypothetical protein
MKVRVIYHVEAEGCWAESPDLPGYSAAADTIPELRELVRTSVREIHSCVAPALPRRALPCRAKPGLA